jgi:hypothetical protein
MTQPILGFTRIGRLPRNSLTQQSLVLPGCEISVVAVPESISARKAGSREKMKPSSRITASSIRSLRTIEAIRPRGVDWS